ncbi:hypothetical protein ACIQUQ_30370 [Streptomyces sp. NPDC101118]|uniref:hypothetical protein n=1 Tax=Streptomyces sp. NPDC101118 TaxID=3366109 RepID=UPI0037FD0250
MKPRTALRAIALTTMPLLLATPAQAAVPETPSSLSSTAAAPVQASGNPFADILDLDAGILAIASGILNINGK